MAVVLAAIFITTACGNKEQQIDYLVLVNKYSQLPDNWEKNVELVDTKNAWKEDIKVEKEAFEHYKNTLKKLIKIKFLIQDLM